MLALSRTAKRQKKMVVMHYQVERESASERTARISARR
jgi:hypothetical protein